MTKKELMEAIEEAETECQEADSKLSLLQEQLENGDYDEEDGEDE